MAERTIYARAPAARLALAPLLALAGLAVGYGLWSKTLSIEGTVHTGSVDARWTRATCAEFHPWPDGMLPGEYEGKDVGWTEVQIDPADDQRLLIRIYNAYPSYAVDCQVHFEVEGTIPVIVRGTTLLPGTNLTDCTLSGGNEKMLACEQLTAVFTDNLGQQLHPGDRAASSLAIHLEQPAEQRQVYEFEVLICMAQWNESVTAGECFLDGP